MCYLVSRCSYHRFLAGLVRAEICRTCQSEFLCFRTLALYLVLLFVALLHFWGQILIGVFRRWRSDEMSAPLIILTSCWWKYGRSDFLWHWSRPSLHWSRPWVLSYHSSLLYSRLCVIGKMHLFFVISIIGGNITLDDIQFDLALLDWNCQGLHKAYTISMRSVLNTTKFLRCMISLMCPICNYSVSLSSI